MNRIGTLVAVAAFSMTTPYAQTRMPILHPASEAAEVYVAELDADWNVAKEIRMACDVDRGCAVDLPFEDASAGRLHVRFDPMRRGKVYVESAIADASGHAVEQPSLSLSLDRNGFGATHLGSNQAHASLGEHRIIMMAVRVPGFLAPTAPQPDPGQPI